MSSYRRGRVVSVEQRGPGVQEARLAFADGEGVAVVLEELVGAVQAGDEVVANVCAVELGLGSGGKHFVLWNLSRDELEIPSRGHIMKLRYTPLQFNVEAVEEKAGEHERGELGDALAGMPVVAGSLHSQLLPVAVAYRHARPDGKLVYVMTDGGSLPLKLSDTVRFLQREGYLAETITCGHAFGGDYEAVNIYGALAAARRACSANAVVALMGPGIVGTGSALGFSGMEQAMVINATASLGGSSIAVPRINFADERERHRGLSHHTASVLRYGARASAHVSLPVLQEERMALVRRQCREAGLGESHDLREVDVLDTIALIEQCGYRVTVMGRTPAEEPEFFMAAAAAGLLAAEIGGD